MGGEAAPNPANKVDQVCSISRFTTASQPIGDKSPHHSFHSVHIQCDASVKTFLTASHFNRLESLARRLHGQFVPVFTLLEYCL